MASLGTARSEESEDSLRTFERTVNIMIDTRFSKSFDSEHEASCKYEGSVVMSVSSRRHKRYGASAGLLHDAHIASK